METTDMVKKALEDKIALAIVDEMTGERIQKMVAEVMNKPGSGWGSRTFFQDLVKSELENSIRKKVLEHMLQADSVIKAAVDKAVSEVMIEKLAENIRVEIGDRLILKVTTEQR